MASVTLTDEQRETVLLEYAQTGTYRAAARKAGCSVDSAQRIVRSSELESDTPVGQMRTQKKVDIAEKMGDVQLVLLDAMMDPAKIKEARFQELAVALGIVTEKRLLMTGQPTVRTETNGPVGQLTPEEKEQARRLRERMFSRESV